VLADKPPLTLYRQPDAMKIFDAVAVLAQLAPQRIILDGIEFEFKKNTIDKNGLHILRKRALVRRNNFRHASAMPLHT
jgi:hypothetical protein